MGCTKSMPGSGGGFLSGADEAPSCTQRCTTSARRQTCASLTPTPRTRDGHCTPRGGVPWGGGCTGIGDGFLGAEARNLVFAAAKSRAQGLGSLGCCLLTRRSHGCPQNSQKRPQSVVHGSETEAGRARGAPSAFPKQKANPSPFYSFIFLCLEEPPGAAMGRSQTGDGGSQTGRKVLAGGWR